MGELDSRNTELRARIIQGAEYFTAAWETMRILYSYKNEGDFGRNSQQELRDE